jgi:pSer/pThr/pTyr-binding forkhead associated (FHA) protein
MPSSTLDRQALRDRTTAKLDALPRLDHRSRSQTIAPEHPVPGRYLAVDDEREQRLIPLDRAVTKIGRGYGADLRLDDHWISRRHAIIANRTNAIRILDDRSSNGTFVNGRRVEDTELHDGDVIVLGRVVLTYVEIPPALP